MPRSFELRTDIAPDRLQAVEDWLRAEGYEYRHQQRRWRTWTRPDRPGEGLRPDGIEEDEEPNVYPSGASINVSLWDVIEKNFPEPGSERRLQGSSSASPGKEKRSAGDKKRDRRWAGVPGVPGRRSRPRRQGRNPSPQSPTGQWWSPPRLHHPWRLHPSRQADPGQAPSAAPEGPGRPQQAPAATWSRPTAGGCRPTRPAPAAASLPKGTWRAPVSAPVGCPATVGLPGNGPGSTALPWRAPAGIAQEEAAEWAHGMAIHAQTVAAIAAGLTAVAAHGAATAQVNGELAAADEEARLTQEAIACKEAEVKALEEALAQERAKKEAEERAHAEATAKAQEDAAKKEAIEGRATEGR